MDTYISHAASQPKLVIQGILASSAPTYWSNVKARQRTRISDTVRGVIWSRAVNTGLVCRRDELKNETGKSKRTTILLFHLPFAYVDAAGFE